MSARQHRRRLAQAQRITALREQRSERLRREAIAAEREAKRRDDAAQARREAADERLADARSAFFKDPACAQTGIWMIAARDRSDHAARESRIASGKHATAQVTSLHARQEHERLRERARMIENEARETARLIARRAQDCEDEDMQERTR